MASNIVKLIPKHTVYCEPFFGGGAVFFKKPYPEITNNNHYREVINDVDEFIINLYRQARDNPEELMYRIGLTPFSRVEREWSISVKRGLIQVDDIDRARACYISLHQSFANSNNTRGCWARSKFTRNLSLTWYSKINNDLAQCLDRLAYVNIECNDALKVIKDWDSPQTFFYLDPPYPNTEQSYSFKYDWNDWHCLVDLLANIEGAMLLSGYYYDDMPDEWDRYEFKATMCAARDKTVEKNRTECLWYKPATGKLRPELEKIIYSPAFNCFGVYHGY